MKKRSWIIILIVVALIAFFIGFEVNSLTEKFSSCKNVLQNLNNGGVCQGKFESDVGTNAVINNIEFFQFNWDADINSTGKVRDYIGGIDSRCLSQAQRQLIETGKRSNLINCFANSISIENSTLDIQCGCLFG